MAVYVLNNAYLNINGVDLSNKVRSLRLSVERDAPDQTVMGDATTRVIAGLKNWSVSVTLAQDFASGSVDATLWTAYDAGTALTVQIKPFNAATSSTNPMYSGQAVITSYGPLDGSVGDFAEVQVELQAAGDLTRATS